MEAVGMTVEDSGGCSMVASVGAMGAVRVGGEGSRELHGCIGWGHEGGACGGDMERGPRGL